MQLRSPELRRAVQEHAIEASIGPLFAHQLAVMGNAVLVLAHIILPMFVLWRYAAKAAHRCKLSGRFLLQTVCSSLSKPAAKPTPPLPVFVIDHIVETYVDAFAHEKDDVLPLLQVSHDVHNATRHALRTRTGDPHDVPMHIVTNALLGVVTGIVDAKVYGQFQLALLRWWPLRSGGADVVIDIPGSDEDSMPYPVLYWPRYWTIYEMSKLDYLYLFLQRKAIPFAIHSAFVCRGVERAYDKDVVKQLWKDAPEELLFNKSGAAYIVHTCMLFMSCARGDDRLTVRGPSTPPTLQDGEYCVSPPVPRIRRAASAWVFSQAARSAAEQLRRCPPQGYGQQGY